MLTESQHVRQIKHDPQRRWFSDDYFDLIVWMGKRGEIMGFQLCYDKPGDERALTWKKETGYVHHRVDTGERERGFGKATPILVTDGDFDYTTIARTFMERSSQIDKRVSRFVYDKLVHYKPHR